MLRAIIRAFNEAFFSLRSNLFPTILSVLGIIIGVGALVAMLSLIDGLEETARQKITDKTSLENIVVTSNQYRSLDGVRVERDNISRLDVATLQDLMTELPYSGTAMLQSTGNEMMRNPRTDSLLGIRWVAVSIPVMNGANYELKKGRLLSMTDQRERTKSVVINASLARRLLPETDSLDAILDASLPIDGDTLTVVGVIDGGSDQLMAMLPLSLLEARKNPPVPRMIMALDNVENVTATNEFTTEWLSQRYPGAEPFEVTSSEFWLEQMAQGFLLFRVIMSLLVGIAVVVGGVGVMNVLLMSISARTAEIGVRKAVGANRKHIITQFLSESIAISLIGSFFGTLLGILASMAVAPVFAYFQPELDFHAVFTLRTLLTVGILAVIVGVIFGTYPARKAAGMDPVEAIRRT